MRLSPLTASGIYERDVTPFLEVASSYIENEKDYFHFIATLSNLSAFIFSYFPDLNWAGFYLFDGDKLIVGPFQGEPACIEIRLGCGVCGRAAEKMESIIVPDVSLFPGHIACSAKSRSEIVIPIIRKDGTLWGLIDIDSPVLNRFSDYEKKMLTSLSSLLSESFSYMI